MRIRLPADVKRWLEKAASANLRTQNAEVVVALRAAMTVKTKTATSEPASSN
ncbi:Arc domain-containing protein [Mesorhizobium sp. B2-3-4]|nr:Arc domain-containing protein [Mesorhizobium sp. B2-3-4]